MKFLRYTRPLEVAGQTIASIRRTSSASPGDAQGRDEGTFSSWVTIKGVAAGGATSETVLGKTVSIPSRIQVHLASAGMTGAAAAVTALAAATAAARAAVSAAV